MPERTRSCSGRQTSSPNEFVRRGQLRDVFVRGKRATTSRGVHVNGGLAITGYSDPRHGIPRVPSPWNFSYVHVYLAPLRPPFYVVRTWLRWKGEKERERNPRGGRKGRGGEALLEEKKRGKMREGEKERKAWGRLCGDSRALPLMGTWYELFVGCSLAFSHCYATTSSFLRVLHFPPPSFSRTLPSSPSLRKKNRCRCENVLCRCSFSTSASCVPKRHQKFVFTPLETDTSQHFLLNEE